MRLDTTLIPSWRIATKVCPIWAKHVGAVVDRTLIDKIYLQTLEANEKLKEEAIVCRGEAGDVWLQTAKTLFKKYNAVELRPDGWVLFQPKPENEVNAIQISPEFFDKMKGVCFFEPPDDEMYKLANFYINGTWGDNEYPKFGPNVQWGDTGDFVCQNTSDPSDVWIVKKRLFVNTYQFKT